MHRVWLKRHFGKEEKEEPRSKYREEAFAWTDRGFLSKELSESAFIRYRYAALPCTEVLK